MNKEDYINSVVSHVKSKRNKQFISKEIGDHIDDGIEFYQSKGYDYETACEKQSVQWVMHIWSALNLVNFIQSF